MPLSFDDLLALRPASVRAKCIIVGGISARYRAASASTPAARAVPDLLFERGGDGAFASRGTPSALAATGTHDLPPLAGWLTGADIALRHQIGLLDTSAAAADRVIRAKDRAMLTDTLRRTGDLQGAATVESLVDGAYRFLARTPSRIVMVQLDDVAGETSPVNLPGTDREHPNWRRKLSVDIEKIVADGRLQRLANIMRELRPREG